MAKSSKGRLLSERQRSQSRRKESPDTSLPSNDIDHFFFKRDQISFDDRQEEPSDELEVDFDNEVLSIEHPSRSGADDATGGLDVDNDTEFSSSKKAKPKSANKGSDNKRGRFAKEESEEAVESSSDDEGGWGRQYYAMPSTRREKQKPEEYNEQREEDREVEENEVKRLQRKAKELLQDEDFGLDDEETLETVNLGQEEQKAPGVPVTEDPGLLLRHMEIYEPVKLALAREWPLVTNKLEKSRRGILKMEQESEGNLHKGLGWLHYQTLLTYASNLAFYIHLCSLPFQPDLAPIVSRLLELKKGLSDLEELDFDAASASGDPLVPPGWTGGETDGDDDDEGALIQAKKELVAKMLNDDDEVDLEEGELDDLIKDSRDEIPRSRKRKSGPSAPKSEKRKAKSSTAKRTIFTASPYTLTEPSFKPSTIATSSSLPAHVDDMGDPAMLLAADAEDKEHRKRSLAFHTAKIASTANRRNAARDKRLGGDEDIPYRDRQAARDAALRRSTATTQEVGRLEAEGNILGEEEEDEAGDDYYQLVKRRKDDARVAKADQKIIELQDRFETRAQLAEDASDGPRTLTRAIEKNRGLTPRRTKAGRNPRVKKRQAYEKAKKKVASQRAVFSGGQASLGGQYQGEKTGISQKVKSRRF